MQFLYFIPNVQRDQSNLRDHVIAAGLGDVLRDRLTNNDLAGLGRLAIASVTNGPGGLNGIIVRCLPFADPHAQQDEPPEAPGYFPKRHTWVDHGKYWIGYDEANLPTVEDLERDQIIGGYYLTLGDGRDWACPVIRQHMGQVNLPDVWRMVQGKIVAAVKPDWQWAWELSGQIWDAHISGNEPTPETAFLWCSKLLGINYRLGPVEASLLGLLGRVEFPLILRACNHGPFIEALKAELKKSEPASSAATPASSTPGAEASTPITVPAEANCTSPPTESVAKNPTS